MSTLNLYIKPVINPVLTSFCTGLTGITQNLLNEKGKSINDAIKIFAGYTSDCRKIVSWGNYDKKFLYDAIIRNNIKENPWLDVLNMLLFKHVNLKEVMKLTCKMKPIDLQNAMKYFGINPTGKLHNALDDSLNTHKIYKKVMKKCKLK